MTYTYGTEFPVEIVHRLLVDRRVSRIVVFFLYRRTVFELLLVEWWDKSSCSQPKKKNISKEGSTCGVTLWSSVRLFACWLCIWAGRRWQQSKKKILSLLCAEYGRHLLRFWALLVRDFVYLSASSACTAAIVFFLFIIVFKPYMDRHWFDSFIFVLDLAVSSAIET